MYTEASSIGIWPALVVAAAWAAREIGALLLKALASSAGRIGYVAYECSLWCSVPSRTGEAYAVNYFPKWKDRVIEHGYMPDREGVVTYTPWLQIRGEIYNEKSVSVTFLEPSVQFFNADGLTFTYKNPRFYVNEKRTKLLKIDANGSARVALKLHISEESLATTFSQTLPVLEVETPYGKKWSFRLSSCSFYGEPIAVWPRKGKLPVVSEPFSTNYEGDEYDSANNEILPTK